MKTTTLLIFCGLLLAPAISFSQTKNINSFYKAFRVLDHNVKMTVPGWMIDVGADIAKLSTDCPQEKESLNLLKKVNKVKLLVSSNNNPKKDQLITDLFPLLRQDSFEDLIQVRDQGTKVNVMVREDDKNQKIKNLFVLVREPEEIVMLSMKTNLRMEEVNDVLNLMEDDLDLDLGID